MSIETDLKVDSFSRLRVLFDLGAGAKPDYLIEVLRGFFESVRFQVGLARASSFIALIESKVADVGPGLDLEWLRHHVERFDLEGERILDDLRADALRYTKEPSRVVRADTARNVFLRDSLEQERLGHLGTSEKSGWSVASIEYRNPLEIIVVATGASASVIFALKSLKWSLDTWTQIQKARLTSVELQKAQHELSRLANEATASRLLETQAQADAHIKIYQTNSAAWEAEKAMWEARSARVETERLERESRIQELKEEIDRKVVANKSASKSHPDIEDAKRDAVLQLLEKRTPTGSYDPAVHIIQATMNVTLQAEIGDVLQAATAQANLLKHMPTIWDTEVS